MEAYIGHLAALTAALFWTVATLLYNQAGSYLNSAQLNLVKGAVACPLLFMAVWLTQLSWNVDGGYGVWLLLASGVIGITLGDTLYFTALRRIGPWYTMLLEYLAPPFAALVAWLALNEWLTGLELIAAAIVLVGIIIVLSERQPAEVSKPSLAGIAAGIGAAACQAIGLVMAFEALAEFSVAPLQAAFVRLFAGTVALTIALLLLRPRIIKQTRAALRHTSVPWLLFAIFMGTFAAIWLQQVSISYISPGIAQTLLATAPLWLIPIQWWRGQALSLRAVSGAVIAVSGIALLFY